MNGMPEQLARLCQLSKHTSALLDFTLGADKKGVIEGYAYTPDADLLAKGEAPCQLDVAYADQARTEYGVLRMRLWIETSPEQNDIHRVGWELLGLEDEHVLAGSKTGYLPDLPKLARFPTAKRTRRASYQFTAYELSLLRLHSGARRERIRRMSPTQRTAEMSHIFYLDDDEIMELGITPAQPLTSADIKAGMIVRRDHHEYRIVLEVHRSISGEGICCVYAPYQPQCVYDAVNPDFEVFRHRGCSTQDLAEWAEKVITYDWDDKVWREDWEALERRQQEALAGMFVLGHTEATGAVVAMLDETGIDAPIPARKASSRRMGRREPGRLAAERAGADGRRAAPVGASCWREAGIHHHRGR